ncbi:hypothetical protein EV361DRAFT_873628 [Lentinula raphanica]|nr:hypothetical protein EV361DRAFT_873628 [Lentinula raphanica]
MSRSRSPECQSLKVLCKTLLSRRLKVSTFTYQAKCSSKVLRNASNFKAFRSQCLNIPQCSSIEISEMFTSQCHQGINAINYKKSGQDAKFFGGQQVRSSCHRSELFCVTLDRCIDWWNTLGSALGMHYIYERYWPPLFFRGFDEGYTSDSSSVEGGSPSEPVYFGSESYIFCWKLPINVDKTDKLVANIEHRPEVKEDWNHLFWQGTTYNGTGTTGISLRSFSVVIAFDYQKHELRFLIFHHGGVTATRKLSLAIDEDCRKICSVMLSILLWQSPADAGIPSCTNGNTFILPPLADNDDAPKGYAELMEVIHTTAPFHDRNTIVASLMIMKPSYLSNTEVSPLSSEYLPEHPNPKKLPQLWTHNLDTNFAEPRWKVISGHFQEWSQLESGILKRSWIQPTIWA